MSGDPIRLKLVVVGDSACGKSCLIGTFTRGYFPTDFVPTVYESYVIDLRIENKPVELDLLDTADRELYDRLRPLVYPNTDGALVCFGINKPDSLENVQNWFSEVRHFCGPDIPIILVGTKTDLRYNPQTIEDLQRYGQVPAMPECGEEMARLMGAKAYFECSAQNKDGLDEVFECAVLSALATRRTVLAATPARRSRRCKIL
ncbi:hypothetical protein BG011_008321 [Mortierella polycephala]|uniref:Uncharacterized protein n=1 Tax=Mortierella polycephala TaxID=41804 RepID=A0A9P6TXJ8_9FUNG|nr:hypothetical protein BG011_008321 [Mortierella polycephala]